MKDIEKALKSREYIDSWSLISEEHHNLLDVFEKKNADKLSPHRKKYDIRIKLESEKILNFNLLYNIL